MPILLPPTADRHDVMAAMMQAGVQTSIHYRPVDTFTAYVEAGLGPSSAVPRTHAIGERTLTLPLYPSMTMEQVASVCEAFENVLTQVPTAA